MILRKPYAFLIKHFKLIHLFISTIIVYLISKTNNILNFFKDYINDDIVNIIPSNYINFKIYLSVILLIGLVSTIIVLLRKKDKPLIFYIMTIIGYSILFIGFSYVGTVIASMQYNILDRKTISLVRDITRFMLIGEYIFLIPYIIRTLGFDIKKFDFKKDLQELDISVEDNEEFELLSPVNVDKVKQKGRRKLRELGYYYIENKLFINIILSVVVLIIGYNILNSIDFSSLKKYDEGDIIKLGNYYSLTIDDSYMTTTNDSGKVISVNDTFYLIVKFSIDSTYNYDLSLSLSKFIIKIDDKEYLPIKTHYNQFKSYGIGYKSQTIAPNANKTYILVYNIPKEVKDKKIRLEYNYGYDYSKSEPKMIKKIVNLSPKVK